MSHEELRPGLHETLLTGRLERLLAELTPGQVSPDLAELANAEAPDRVSRHVAQLVARMIEAAPEQDRAAVAVHVARKLIGELETLASHRAGLAEEVPLEPGRVLHALLRRRPDGSAEPIERPLTPLLDTTVLTNAPGEPAVGHELRAEIASADAIDVVMAFIRWSGVRPLIDALDATAPTESAARPHDDVHEQHRAARAR